MTYRFLETEFLERLFSVLAIFVLSFSVDEFLPQESMPPRHADTQSDSKNLQVIDILLFLQGVKMAPHGNSK
jgi:hypothetical protein